MTTNKESVYWFSNENWYSYNIDSDKFTISSDAPERAKKSFELWSKECRKNEENEKAYRNY